MYKRIQESLVMVETEPHFAPSRLTLFTIDQET
jgi:hypothetical protein